MPTINLLSGLQVYFFLLSSLTEQELKGIHDSHLLKTVSLAYNTITSKLIITDTKNPSLLYLQATFQINQQKVTFKELYSQNQDRENEIKKLILHKTPQQGYVWDTNIKVNLYSQQIEQYLAIADEIAKKGYLCSTGDDYQPGYFSEISITNDEIILKQINHYNSRSIDHKDDYHMRDLEFYIPLKPIKEKKPQKIGRTKYQIGDMIIYYSDLSSEKNKDCGNGISDKIQEEELRFKQEH